MLLILLYVVYLTMLLCTTSPMATIRAAAYYWGRLIVGTGWFGVIPDNFISFLDIPLLEVPFNCREVRKISCMTVVTN